MSTLWCLFANERFYLRAQWIWFLNLLCLILHTFVAVLVFERGGRNPEGMKIHVWRLQQTWNNASALGYTVDVVANDSPIRLDLLTGAFFTISAVAHLFAVAVGPFDRWISIYWRQIDLGFLYWCASHVSNLRATPFPLHRGKACRTWTDGGSLFHHAGKGGASQAAVHREANTPLEALDLRCGSCKFSLDHIFRISKSFSSSHRTTREPDHFQVRKGWDHMIELACLHRRRNLVALSTTTQGHQTT